MGRLNQHVEMWHVVVEIVSESRHHEVWSQLRFLDLLLEFISQVPVTKQHNSDAGIIFLQPSRE